MTDTDAIAIATDAHSTDALNAHATLIAGVWSVRITDVNGDRFAYDIDADGDIESAEID